ncbi:MAG: hypothetical protein HQ501_14200 [Rhodospirillales bacterium]|nr:hypothetical protein [Rhodospirillales bacterium]
MEFEDDDPIRYDHWIEEALRGVIRQALAYTAENGLTGNHHFYVTFRTDTGAIDLPDFLRAQHPTEMTIVLQHQYEHLSVDDDRFFVTLRFNGQAVNLNIPLDEITGFTDPSVNFGLQLKTTDLDEDDLEEYDYPFEPPAEEQDCTEQPTAVKPISFATIPAAVKSKTKSADDGKTGDAESGDAESADKNDDVPQTGEVITLDAFRKK